MTNTHRSVRRGYTQYTSCPASECTTRCSIKPVCISTDCHTSSTARMWYSVASYSVTPCTVSNIATKQCVSSIHNGVTVQSVSIAMLPSGGSVHCTPMSLGVPSTSPTMPIPLTQTPLNMQPIPVVPSTQPTSTHLMTVPETTPPNQGAPTTVVMPATLTQQLPPIPWFKGEDPGESDSFQDWIEQFESVAILGGWSEQGKLVHLTTRLKGAAYSFYRSCTPTERASYKQLVARLKERFTPVKLTAIQTQYFHDRQQGPKETVDEYAQALRKLFKTAYTGVLRNEPGSAEMGQTVLTNLYRAYAPT